MLSVGVDAWNLPGDHRGIGRYVRSILSAWRAHGDRVRVTLIVPEWHTWTVRGRYLREVDGAPYRIVSRAFHHRAGLDVLWFPWNGCSWTNFSLPAVATLHDASNFVIPGYAPETQTIFRAAATHCKALITVSAFSRAELIRELALDEATITSILCGVSVPPAITPPPSIEAMRPFVLFVGTTERRKGVDTLYTAMARVQGRHPEVQLVLAGAPGDAVDESGGIRKTELGWVNDATLEELYAAASVFAFPTRYEGFGLPPLEAMARGVPVVTTPVASIPEVAADAAAYVPVEDDAALADAIVRIIDDSDYANDLRERGRRRASELTWDKTALATLAVLERAAL